MCHLSGHFWGFYWYILIHFISSWIPLGSCSFSSSFVFIPFYLGDTVIKVWNITLRWHTISTMICHLSVLNALFWPPGNPWFWNDPCAILVSDASVLALYPIILQDTTTKQSAAVIHDDINFLHTPRIACTLVERTLNIYGNSFLQHFLTCRFGVDGCLCLKVRLQVWHLVHSNRSSRAWLLRQKFGVEMLEARFFSTERVPVAGWWTRLDRISLQLIFLITHEQSCSLPESYPGSWNDFENTKSFWKSDPTLADPVGSLAKMAKLWGVERFATTGASGVVVRVNMWVNSESFRQTLQNCV